MSDPMNTMTGDASTEHSMASARSFLFVPGNRPERFMKAVASGADVVVLDLEDSVPPDARPTARTAIGEAWAELHGAGVPVTVRINAPETAFGADDLDWLSAFPVRLRPAAVMVPKVENAASLQRVRTTLPGALLLPIIESAAAYLALAEIAAAPSVVRLVVGHIDFMADTGLQCSDNESELAPLRFAIAMATRVQRLAPAIDGVTVEIADDAKLMEQARRALRYGFGAKLCIHPRQIAVVHAAMAPADAEVDWARRVIAADRDAGGAAVQVDGRMVDAPVVLQARRTLSRLRAAVLKVPSQLL